MTARIEKTVFISYRRTNVPWALAIYQNLTTHGYDVFFDYQSIDSGNFEKVILENIKARAHFLVILTPSALERCNEPGDWLRREIEIAMDEKRNIVPVMLESFDFGSPLVKDALTGKLAMLSNLNGLRVYSEYFFEAMNKLRERYLNVAVSDISLPALNLEAKEITETQKVAANQAETVNTMELRNQEIFELSYGFLRIPILGPIAAGLLMLASKRDTDYLDTNEYRAIEVPRSLLPSKEKGDDLYALEVRGDSMIDAMINDGDIIVMKPAAQARNGEMVAVRVNDEYTLKYFFKEKDRYRLQPANPTMKPIFIKSNDPPEINGKVVMVIRKSDTPSST